MAEKITFSCQDCGVEHICEKRTDRQQTRCPSCARKNGWKSRERPAPEPKAPYSKIIPGATCERCGALFTARTTTQKYCSATCRVEAGLIKQGCRNRNCMNCGSSLGYYSRASLCTSCKDERHSVRRKMDRASRPKGMESHRRRARKHGAEYEVIDRDKVFERDNWMCGICGDPISKDATYPDLMSPSLDHIKPLSRGGDHLYSNVQASHFMCNSVKGAGSGDEVRGASDFPESLTLF